MRNMRRWASALAILAALGLLAGCPAPEKEKDGEKAGKDTASKEKGKHDHADQGPHGGPLADWDHKYHAEFTVDHKKKEARVYILGPDAKTPAPIKADKVTLSMKKPRFQIDLKPQKQKDDPEGTASVFV